MGQLFFQIAFQADFSPIQAFFQQPADKMLLQFFFSVGWIPIAAVFVWGVVQLWVFYCQTQYSMSLKFHLLAIDIPRGNYQSPKAVENIFTYIAGAHNTFNLIEKYWDGLYQLSFSFEIISIEGYTQFLVWTTSDFKDLTETAIYSQYPDAEITEVNDYTQEIPSKFPDDEYDCWGCEFIPAKHWSLPIKTWRSFEHPSGPPEEQFKDPMATLMDLHSTLGKGEHLWHQIIVYPTGYEWPEEGDREISKIIGEKVPRKKNIVDKLIDILFALLTGFSEMIYSFGNESTAETKEDDNRFLMMNLKPKQKKQIEAIQEKCSQLGFRCKVRFIYVAKKDVMNKLKVRNGFIGYMKQFMDLDTNNLKPDMDMTATSADYFFEQYIKNEKKTRLMAAYKGRSGTRGKKRWVLTIEELATLWHFPVEAVVKAPLIQKAPGRKSEPPMALPIVSEDEIDSRLFDDRTTKTGEDIFSEDFEETEKKEFIKKESTSDKVAEDKDDDSAMFDLEKDTEKTTPPRDGDKTETETKPVKKGTPPSNLPFA